MQVVSQGNNTYLVTLELNSSKKSYTLKVFEEEQKLHIIIKANSPSSKADSIDIESVYTYGKLIDIDRRFRGYDFMENILEFIVSVIKEGKIRIIQNENGELTLYLNIYGGDIKIPISSKNEKKNEPVICLNCAKNKYDIIKEKEKSKLINNENIILKTKIDDYENTKVNYEKMINAFKEIADKNMKEIKNLMTETDPKKKTINKKKESSTSDKEDEPKKDKKFSNYLNEIKLTKELNHQIGEVKCLCLTADRRLASCSDDKTVKIFNLEDFTCEMTLEGHTDVVSYVGLLTNGCLISTSLDHSIKIWELKDHDYKCLATLTKHNDAVWKACEISDERICSCSSDCSVMVWKNTAPYDDIATLKGHKSSVFSFIELKNKKYILSCCYGDDKLLFWNTTDYKCEKELSRIDCPRYGNNCLLEINDNKVLVGGRNKITVIDTTTLQVKSKVKLLNAGFICSIVEFPNNLIITGSAGGEIFEVDLDGNQILSKKEKAHEKDITSLILLDDKKLISSSNDKTIKIWN